jgi:Tfp pilus assembly protein PilV
MKKRLVAFLLVLIMVLGMLPVSAMAAGSVVTARQRRKSNKDL